MTIRQAEGSTATAPPTAAARRRITVRGVVQGVGFRPFVHTLATELGLTGHVTNTGEGVVAEVEGAPAALARFGERLSGEAPPLAVVETVDGQDIALAGDTGFRILPSRAHGPSRTLVAPDAATCAACLAELTDPADRRHRHPFLSCTHCGPRFTIVTAIPYDRALTTMDRFPMCPRCAREYADPGDRRFHAQPIACHDCGPRLRLLTADPADRTRPRSRHPAPIRSPTPGGCSPRARSWPSKASAATTSSVTPPTTPPSPCCATARPAATNPSP